MEDDKAIREAEELAATIMVEFGKSCRTYPTSDELEVVENCFQVAGCNNGKFPDLHRRIECWCILRYCIMPCDRAELRRIERTLLEIAAR